MAAMAMTGGKEGCEVTPSSSVAVMGNAVRAQVQRRAYSRANEKRRKERAALEAGGER
jgi:hypothetical protein